MDFSSFFSSKLISKKIRLDYFIKNNLFIDFFASKISQTGSKPKNTYSPRKQEDEQWRERRLKNREASLRKDFFSLYTFYLFLIKY